MCNNKTKGSRELHMNIRTEREARGWSLQQVADRIGISKVSIYRIETLKEHPSYTVYCRLMSLFGRKVPRLVFGEAGGEPPSGNSVPQEEMPV